MHGIMEMFIAFLGESDFKVGFSPPFPSPRKGLINLDACNVLPAYKTIDESAQLEGVHANIDW